MPVPVWTPLRGLRIVWYPLHQVFAVSRFYSRLNVNDVLNQDKCGFKGIQPREIYKTSNIITCIQSAMSNRLCEHSRAFQKRLLFLNCQLIQASRL